MRMQLREIGLLALALCLLVSYCVGFTQQGSGTTTEAASAESQVTQVNTDFDRSHVLVLRGVLKGRKTSNVTGVVGVFFAIYEQQQGGAPLWQEVQNVEVDARGHFTVLVGSNTVGGIPPELFTTEKTLWVGEQVQLLGEVERPRFQLVSTPKGLVAGSAGMTRANSSDHPGSERRRPFSRPQSLDAITPLQQFETGTGRQGDARPLRDENYAPD
jgi:hypothetical protein